MRNDGDAMKAHYEVRDGYLRVQLQGVFDQTSSHGLAHEIVEQARRSGRTRLLCDLTAVAGLEPDSASIWDHIELSQFVAHVIPKDLRVAVLETPQQLIGGRVGEDLMVQRGAHVRVTSSMDEALAWLGVTPEPSLGGR
jgi:hypothetical protein